jgi:hypothetical protein
MWFRHNISLLAKIPLEGCGYKICKSAQKNGYSKLLEDAKKNIKAAKFDLNEVRYALLLQKRINDNIKSSTDNKVKIFLTAFIVPILAALTLSVTTSLDIFSEFIGTLPEGTNHNQVGNDVFSRLFFIFDQRISLMGRILFIMVVFIVIVWISSRFHLFLLNTNKRSAYYFQYIEDCIVIVDEILEQKPDLPNQTEPDVRQ